MPIGVLGGLADDLVAMHGQSAQQSLLQPARQRQALDRYAGPAVAEPLAEYKACFERLKKIESTLEELTTRARERAQEADLLRFGLAEVERLEPVEGEDAELEAEAERLGHADTLRTASGGAHMALAGSPDDPALDQRPVAGVGGDPGPGGRARATTRRWPSWPRGWTRPRSCSPTSPPSWPPTPTRSRPTRAGWPTSSSASATSTA